jgi:hypothetical protein
LRKLHETCAPNSTQVPSKLALVSPAESHTVARPLSCSGVGLWRSSAWHGAARHHEADCNSPAGAVMTGAFIGRASTHSFLTATVKGSKV